jgi:hypothetical protein
MFRNISLNFEDIPDSTPSMYISTASFTHAFLFVVCVCWTGLG